MKILGVRRLDKGYFEVTIRHNWVERLFGFCREEKRFIRDSGVNFPGGGSMYFDSHGNLLEPGDALVSKVDEWRKADSKRREDEEYTKQSYF